MLKKKVMYHELSNYFTLLGFSLSTAFTIIEAIVNFSNREKKKAPKKFKKLRNVKKNIPI